MTSQLAVTFAVSAVKDLEEIQAWYAEQQVPDVGERLLREVLSQVERLADFPESGRIVPEFGAAHLREIIHPPFRIVYRLDKTPGAYCSRLAERANTQDALDCCYYAHQRFNST